MKVKQLLVENTMLNLKYPNIEFLEYVIVVFSSRNALFL